VATLIPYRVEQELARWERGDWFLATGATIALAAAVQTAFAIEAEFNFASGLVSEDRIANAFSGFGLLSPFVVVIGVVLGLLGLLEGLTRLRHLRRQAVIVLAGLAVTYAALLVLGILSAGYLMATELDYSGQPSPPFSVQAVTVRGFLLTLLTYGPLATLLAALAIRLAVLARPSRPTRRAA
jgi:hypothetical protein